MNRISRFLRASRFKKRHDVLNYLVRTRGYRDYLEIGVNKGRCMRRVHCERKTGVDPQRLVEPRGWTLHRETSDEFFAHNRDRFDLVFVDGLHLARNALADILNGLAVLRPEGMVLAHDCNPASEAAQRPDPELARSGGWHGDVWKAIAYIRSRVPAAMCRTLDLDKGVAVVLPIDPNGVPRWSTELRADAEQFFGEISWNELDRDRADVLGLIAGRADLERELSHVLTGCP